MPAKRRAKRKQEDETLPNPGERQLARLPSWWETADQGELQKANARAKQLVAGEPISWDELTGRQ